MGNKREIAESRISELNTYMKVITFNFMHGAAFIYLFIYFIFTKDRVVGMLGILCSVRRRSLQLSGLNDAVGG